MQQEFDEETGDGGSLEVAVLLYFQISKAYSVEGITLSASVDVIYRNNTVKHLRAETDVVTIVTPRQIFSAAASSV